MKNTLRSIGTHLQRGVSLLEVLITVVVVSIGLLGLAGLQFAGLRAANSAQEHTLASLLAQDIAERIRANRAANYYSPMISLATGGPAPAADVDCGSSYCVPGDMLAFDKRRWYYMINSGGDTGIDNPPILPHATIAVSSTDGISYQIAITWGDPSGPQTLNAQFSL